MDLVILLGIVIISYLIFFIMRKNKVGDIIVSARLSEVRFIWLILGIFMVILGFNESYFAADPFVWISPIMIGISEILIFSTSTVYIGLKGISLPNFPYYIPLNQLSSYTLIVDRLTLKRYARSECKITINVSDVKKVMEAMNNLSIKKN